MLEGKEKKQSFSIFWEIFFVRFQPLLLFFSFGTFFPKKVNLLIEFREKSKKKDQVEKKSRDNFPGWWNKRINGWLTDGRLGTSDASDDPLWNLRVFRHVFPSFSLLPHTFFFLPNFFYSLFVFFFFWIFVRSFRFESRFFTT